MQTNMGKAKIKPLKMPAKISSFSGEAKSVETITNIGINVKNIPVTIGLYRCEIFEEILINLDSLEQT